MWARDPTFERHNGLCMCLCSVYVFVCVSMLYVCVPCSVYVFVCVLLCACVCVCLLCVSVRVCVCDNALCMCLWFFCVFVFVCLFVSCIACGKKRTPSEYKKQIGSYHQSWPTFGLYAYHCDFDCHATTLPPVGRSTPGRCLWPSSTPPSDFWCQVKPWHSAHSGAGWQICDVGCLSRQPSKNLTVLHSC